MNIIEAVKEAKTGEKIRRKEWFFINKDNCIYIAEIRNLKNEISHLFLFGIKGIREFTINGREVASFTFEDVLAEDWEVVEDKNCEIIEARQ